MELNLNKVRRWTDLTWMKSENSELTYFLNGNKPVLIALSATVPSLISSFPLFFSMALSPFRPLPFYTYLSGFSYFCSYFIRKERFVGGYICFCTRRTEKMRIYCTPPLFFPASTLPKTAGEFRPSICTYALFNRNVPPSSLATRTRWRKFGMAIGRRTLGRRECDGRLRWNRGGGRIETTEEHRKCWRDGESTKWTCLFSYASNSKGKILSLSFPPSDVFPAPGHDFC